MTLSARSDNVVSHHFERPEIASYPESDWCLFGLFVSAGACTSQTVMNQSQLPVAPTLTVERFLQAANTRDLVMMSRLFGNDDGPIADSGNREEIELRMNVIAEILQHHDYEIVSECMVPGAEVPSNRIGVDLTLPQGLMVRDVGFTVVLESPNRWLINVIELVKITEA